MARVAVFVGVVIAACLFAAAGAEAACNPVTDCSGHGVCLPNDTCACDAGFTGASCNQCGPNYYNYPTCTFCQASTTCNGNGLCSPTGGCVCNVGFIGASCNQCGPNYYNYPTCSFCQASTTCSGNGSCNLTGGCDCNPGWIGAACDTAVTSVPVAAPWARVLLALLLTAVAGAPGWMRRSRG